MRLRYSVKKIAKNIVSKKIFLSMGAVILALFSADKAIQQSDGYSEDLSKDTADTNFGFIVPKAYADNPHDGGTPGTPSLDGGGGDCPGGAQAAL